MGLDLCVEGRALHGHEAEWESLVRRYFAAEDLSEADVDRFQSISQPAYASLGAPRVGSDTIADDWIAAKMADRMTREEAIAEHMGYHVIALVESDGVPKFSHAGLYEGVDETSFRGKFLELCTSVLSQQLIDDAWQHRMPDEAIDYGQSLFAAASDVKSGRTLEPRKPSFFRRLVGRSQSELSLNEQMEIVEAAGRWFVFWGSRGHPIRAYY